MNVYLTVGAIQHLRDQASRNTTYRAAARKRIEQLQRERDDLEQRLHAYQRGEQ